MRFFAGPTLLVVDEPLPAEAPQPRRPIERATPRDSRHNLRLLQPHDPGSFDEQDRRISLRAVICRVTNNLSVSLA